MFIIFLLRFVWICLIIPAGAILVAWIGGLVYEPFEAERLLAIIILGLGIYVSFKFLWPEGGGDSQTGSGAWGRL